MVPLTSSVPHRLEEEEVALLSQMVNHLIKDGTLGERLSALPQNTCLLTIVIH